MKRIIAIILTAILTLSIVSCGGSASRLTGRWEGDENGFKYIEFFSDGTYTSSDPNHGGNYSIDGDRIKLAGILDVDYVYTFDVKGSTMTFTDDKGRVANYTKTK